jgi:hypothetical protein
MHRTQKRCAIALAAACLAVVQTLSLGTAAHASSGSSGHVERLKLHSTFRLSHAGGQKTTQTPQAPPHQPMSKTIRHTSAAGVPSIAGNAVTSTQLPGFSGFNAVSNLDQVLAGTGSYANSQFDLEPPDQGLCVGTNSATGHTNVIEPVNVALNVYDTGGNSLLPGSSAVALNQFFGLAPESVNFGPPFGDFVSDPRCYYDPADRSWFLTSLQIGVVPSTGAFGTTSELLVAVNKSGDPVNGTWSIYTLDTTDTGGNGCPCFGDQPLIGADANGFYITTNEYSIAGPQFNGAQVYAMSKSALEGGSGGAIVNAVHLQPGTSTSSLGGLAFSIEPAESPTAVYNTSNGGTEYFMSATDWGAAPALGTRANSLLVWALTGTSTLGNTSPSVSLSFVQVPSELYAQPPNAIQKPGPLVLNKTLPLLDANDDRLLQVVYAAGNLWSSLNTAVKLPTGATAAGAAYFEVTPADPQGGSLSAALTHQGYVGVDKQNVIFPSVGVTPAGKAVMTFTLVGPGYFPSGAYVPIDPTTGQAGAISISGAGQLPEDGFTALKAFGGHGATRWGDYSAAVSDAGGTIWMGDEYIANQPRDLFANWNTFVSAVTP